MSPITLFTNRDAYSKQVKVALDDCALPYTEICLSQYPQKRKDLLHLTGCKVSVPQMFVHNQWIGGVDAALSFLRDFSAGAWNSPQWLEGSPLEKLERQSGTLINGNGNSQNPRFMVPIMEEDDEVEDTSGVCENDEVAVDGAFHGPLADMMERTSSLRSTSASDQVRIQCPDGNSLTVLQMTEKLKQILHYGKRRYNFTSYKNCCTAEEVVDSLVETYNISRKQGEEFGKLLYKRSMIHHVCDDHDFEDTPAWFFRLQCFHTPAILNSYRVWRKTGAPADPEEVMSRLTVLFNHIEEAVIGLDGNTNYRIAYMSSFFPMFEDAVCELQRVDLSELEGADMMAFALNVYNMMTKYSFMKMGVPVSESGRTKFLDRVKFNIAGHVFSLQEWLDGILRGNRKSPVTKKTHAFCKRDPRIALASKVGSEYARDCRLHFAIHWWSRSRRSPPVKIYTGAALEEELSFVAHAFCEEDDNVAFNIKEKKMRVAPVFRRYKNDFAEHSRSVPRVVSRFLYGQRRAKLERFLNKSHHGRSLKMSSRAEDWTLGMSDFVAFDSSKLKPNVLKVGKLVRSTTSASSYRPDSSRGTGNSLRSSAISDNDNSSVSSARSSTASLGSLGLGRLLPTRKLSGGGMHKRAKTDSIPKPFMRRNTGGDMGSAELSYDDIESNVSTTSACSSNVSEHLIVLDEIAMNAQILNRAA